MCIYVDRPSQFQFLLMHLSPYTCQSKTLFRAQLLHWSGKTQPACKAALRTRSLAPSIEALDLAISAMIVPVDNVNKVACK